MIAFPLGSLMVCAGEAGESRTMKQAITREARINVSSKITHSSLTKSLGYEREAQEVASLLIVVPK
jgi:hypothetical protein